MRKPVCKYPKQPTGPSGFGESGVRKLQRTGGNYQKSRPDANTVSTVSGDFSRVTIDGAPEYVSVAYENGEPVVRDTMDHRRKFTKSLASKNVQTTQATGEGGVYMSIVPSNLEIAQLEYEYEIYPGTTQSVIFGRDRFNLSVSFGGYFTKGRTVSGYSVYYMYLPLTPGNFIFYKALDEVDYWGKHPTRGVCSVSLSIARFSRVDPANNRPLADLTLVRHSSKSVGQLEEYPINPSQFTRPNAEFMWLTRQVVLKDFTVGVFAETFFRPGPVAGGDYIPKFWAVTTPNNAQFGTFTFTDLTAGVFTGARQPTQSTSPVPHYTTTAGRLYQFDLSATMASLTIAAVANDAFVAAWQQRMPGGWRARVARFVVAGGSVSAAMARETTDQPARTTLEYWQSIEHLGNGVVLAKITKGFPGTERDVVFRLSSDGGASWGPEFAPVGFSAPLKNQYFGDLAVNKATKPDSIGRVLIPAWDVETSSYYVWASDDHGATWSKKGKIYKPESFMRVDSMLTGDGGGNFQTLARGPKIISSLDVTLPDRYKDRS